MGCDCSAPKQGDEKLSNEAESQIKPQKRTPSITDKSGTNKHPKSKTKSSDIKSSEAKSPKHSQNVDEKSSTQLTSKIDRNIFETPSKERCRYWPGSREEIINCPSLHRAMTASKYYDILYDDNQSSKSVDGKEIFTTFCIESYPDFLNDYIHIITAHDEHLTAIAHQLRNEFGFNKCAINKCCKITRHYRRERTLVVSDDNTAAEQDFYCTYFDQLHHFIYHLFDIGMRTEIKENKQKDDYDSDDSDDSNNVNTEGLKLDTIFAAKRDLIRSKRKQYGDDIDRFNQENNKYNIKLDKFRNEVGTTRGTFTDEMCSFLDKDENVNVDVLIQLKKYCDDNEYDTDGIEGDLEDLKETTGSNISNHVKNESCIQLVQECIKAVKLSGTSFSTGFCFVYWDGKQEDKLYVAPHYESLKEEILASGFVGIDGWNNKIIVKAQKYIKTAEAKYLSSSMHNNMYTERWTEITLSHLISIILYCDWSDLCTHFSATFRKEHAFEPLQATKLRHSKYYHFSKALVETVVDYGNDHYDDDGEYNTCDKGGPFYCGVSCVLNIASFAIKLKGPCSTSMHMEVSINFAKRAGMIIQFQNDGSGSWAKMFDCSWLSQYGEEAERLFIHGYWPLRMQSVRIIETATNYESFFTFFHVLDAMLTGADPGWAKSLPSHVSMLEKFMDSKVNGIAHGFDKYICDTFDLFCYQKNEIIIHIRRLKRCFGDLKHLIINSIVDKDETCGDNENQNILKPNVFKLFPNVKTVVIQTTFGDLLFIGEYTSYSFSLLSFLSFIEQCRASVTYKIIAQCPDRNRDNGETWLNDIVTPSIQQKYHDHKWNIYATKGHFDYEDKTYKNGQWDDEKYADIVTITKDTINFNCHKTVIIDADLVPHLMDIMSTEKYEVVKEEILAVGNSMMNAADEQIKYLVDEGIISAMFMFMKLAYKKGDYKSKALMSSLEMLEKILNIGSETDEFGIEGNNISKLIQECKGADTVKLFKDMDNEKIRPQIYDKIDAIYCK